MDKNKIAVEVFNKNGLGYQDKFMNVDLYKDSLDLFCTSIDKSDPEILEVACGPGNITKYLLEKRSDLSILGTDLAPKMIELAKQNNPQADFGLMDCREIGNLDKKFDGIMCGFAFPYLSKEEAIMFIEDSSKILNSRGVLYLSTMEDDYSKSTFKKGSTGDEIFMHYHEAGYLLNALEENGFQLLDLRRQEYPEKDGSVSIDLIILARLSSKLFK